MMTGGPGMAAIPLRRPARVPVPRVGNRPGSRARRGARQSKPTAASRTQAMSRRKTSAGRIANPWRPGMVPTTAPRISQRRVGQWASPAISGTLTRPTMSCSTKTQGTTTTGSSTKASIGTAARAKPNPLNPRITPAMKVPTADTARACQDSPAWRNERSMGDVPRTVPRSPSHPLLRPKCLYRKGFRRLPCGPFP